MPTSSIPTPHPEQSGLWLVIIFTSCHHSLTYICTTHMTLEQITSTAKPFPCCLMYITVLDVIVALWTTAIVIEMCLCSPCFNTEDDYEISSGTINQPKDVITCFSCWNGCLITALRHFFHLISSLVLNPFCDLEDKKKKFHIPEANIRPCLLNLWVGCMGIKCILNDVEGKKYSIYYTIG